MKLQKAKPWLAGVAVAIGVLLCLFGVAYATKDQFIGFACGFIVGGVGSVFALLFGEFKAQISYVLTLVIVLVIALIFG